MYTCIFPPFFPALCECCSFPNFLLFSDFFLELSVFSVTKSQKSDIVYARAQGAILRSSGHSVNEIAKFLNKTEHWVNKRSKRECFKDKPRSRRPFVLTIVLENQSRKGSTATQTSCQKNLPRMSPWVFFKKSKVRSLPLKKLRS